MKRILSWYWDHFLHAYNCEESWPWQRKWWSLEPESFKKRMQRLWSFLIILFGFNAFILTLMMLVVLVGLVIQ